MKSTYYILLILLLMTNEALLAQKTDKNKKDMPGDTSLPSTDLDLKTLAMFEKGDYDYNVEDYFKRPDKSAFELSPNGKYFSYRQRGEGGKRHVYIKDIATAKSTKIIEEKEELIADYGWANNNRILYAMDKGGDENYQLYAIDVDGKNKKELTPFEGVRTQILELLKDQPDHIIIGMNKTNKQIFEPYKLNIKTGDLEKLFENTDVSNAIAGYNFDKEGNLRAYTRQQNGTEYVLYYRFSNKEPFVPVITTTWKDNFSIIGFNYATDNPHDAYVLSNMENDKDEIVLYDLQKKKKIKNIYKNPVFDVAGMRLARKRNYEIDYYRYTGERDIIVPVSDTFKKMHNKFQTRFPMDAYAVASTTDKEDKYLIICYSDRLYGIYYLYDVAKGDFTEVMNIMPSLRKDDMATMQPIEFKSRDGLMLSGYLTLPNGIHDGDRVPMIVNPHGGPYGPRDEWRFNPEVQLFASRGYATLQINYRGSGGYGKTFSQAGNKQIGRKMLDDLEDGVEYVKAIGVIDSDKIAIYGASYGGLATLGSLIKTPNLYTCGVDYVGVSNLFTFFKSFPPYWKPYLAQVYEQWYDENDPKEQEIMKEVSPALNVDKIKKPLFVVQGANDPRVNINESDQVVVSLRKRGYDVPYMVRYNEGHGFGHEDNRIVLYRSMMGFFAKYLK